MTRTTIAILIAAAVPAATFHAARAAGDPPATDIEMSTISGDPGSPRRHFRLRRSAELTPRRAEAIYGIVAQAMAAGYARSGLAVARQYGHWKRHNQAPYPSSTHGNHYLNNYANAIAADYGCAEEAGRMPVGSVVAKDSFSVTESGGILLGPLFVMEKMPVGFHYVSGDWRYTMILPDGMLFGTTRGQGEERVRYCISCHLAVERQDHLYFVPSGMRADTCP